MIKMTEYAKRRKALMQKVGANSMVIIPGAHEVIRNGDSVYPFRQNSDFYYLTGFVEPDAVLVLLPKHKEGEYILFNRPRDPAHEVWDGPRAGQQGARKQFLANQSFPIEDLKFMLPLLLADRQAIHYPIGQDKKFDSLILNTLNQLRSKVRRGVQAPISLIDVSSSIHEMRLIKSPAEVALMQEAADISASAHLLAMEICQPGMNECELEAVLSYEFKRQGAQHPAYTSIVGAGKNSCVLHYVNNNESIHNNDLVLIDAGAEYQHYASDITRTFPANGRFTKEQRAIYELVLKSQLAAIAKIKPGVSWTAMQDIIVKVITEGLKKLGILKGKLSVNDFYMHSSGHWLGLDVHDAGSYKANDKWRTLKAGMVLTVEPGIYISSQSGVHKRWHNIGVRIEDDVLVTSKGCKVLSQHLPKSVDDIEAIMGR